MLQRTITEADIEFKKITSNVLELYSSTKQAFAEVKTQFVQLQQEVHQSQTDNPNDGRDEIAWLPPVETIGPGHLRERRGRVAPVAG